MNVFPFIEAEKAEQQGTVARSCALLEVSRSAFYVWHQHVPSARRRGDEAVPAQPQFEDSRHVGFLPRRRANEERAEPVLLRERLFEAVFGRLVARILVGVVLDRHLPEGFFYFCFRSVAMDTEHFVIITFFAVCHN